MKRGELVLKSRIGKSNRGQGTQWEDGYCLKKGGIVKLFAPL